MNRLSYFLITVNLVLGGIFFPGGVQAKSYGGGGGTPNDPYQIRTAEQMNRIGTDPNNWISHFVLTTDLDMSAYSGTQYNMIGNSTTPFTGTFEGNRHILSNLTIARAYADEVGLFGSMGPGGQIRNLGLEHTTINGSNKVGGLVGYNSQGTITACHISGTVRGQKYVGGVAGWNDQGTLKACYTSGAVSGYRDSIIVGGLVGFDSFGTITACYATGTVDGYSTVGGLVGYHAFDGTLTGCYASGAVNGYSTVGGLVGSNQDLITDCYATGTVSGFAGIGGLVGFNNNALITACYATGRITGYFDIGGLVGYNQGTITACFWDMETSGKSISSGGTGKTTVEMKTASTFAEAGWDFVGESVNGTRDRWRMCGESVAYPRLSWEFSRAGDLDCPDGVTPEDLAYLAQRWMMSMAETFGTADATGDGRVDLEDFAILAKQWMR